MKVHVAIIGGGIGGTMAAYTVAKLGYTVLLTEETPWIGGQLTSQGVPPDEHQWIEEFGCTDTYRKFRNQVREYYENKYPLNTQDRLKKDKLNPGNAWVSRIAHEPRVSLNILYEFIQPYLSNGRLKLLLEHKIKSVESTKDTIQSVTVQDKRSKEDVVINADIFLDATELGDLLPLAGVEYVVGAESKEDSGEENALNKSDPLDQQSITHVFALDYNPGEDHTINKPEDYEFWRNYQASFFKHKQLSEYIPDPHTGEPKRIRIFNEGNELGLWEYRRIIDALQFEKGFYKGDISLINWPQNDYWLGPIVDVSEQERNKHLEGARQLSLSLLYWLQTEAPRKSGKFGYPELRLRPDVVGSKDGMALHPYIRESRRIKSLYTITEEAINAEMRKEKDIKRYKTSVGIGAYRIDLHPTTNSNRMFYAKSYPFEIPLGALIPKKIKNLLPACKNIGTTQLTNGCYRVHPVEWNIGESTGALAAFAIKHKKEFKDIHNDDMLLKDYQRLLRNLGISLHWPEVKAF